MRSGAFGSADQTAHRLRNFWRSDVRRRRTLPAPFFSIGYPRDLAENLRIPLGTGHHWHRGGHWPPVLVGDTHARPAIHHAIDDVRSELAVPLMLQGRCIGVLDIQSPHPELFQREQQNILPCWPADWRSPSKTPGSIERNAPRAETLLLLNEVSRETSSILDVEELLRRAAEQLKRVIDYQILSLMLYDEKQKVFRHRLDVKHGQRRAGQTACAVREGIVGAAATLKAPVRVPDVSIEPRYLMANPETRSELAIPMIHKGQVIGVLDLESPQLNYFTEDHVQTLSILAANLAVSLENARLYEKLARDEARLERDLQAAKRIQGALLRPYPTKTTASTWRPAISPRAKSAATSTNFFATARSNSASPLAMSAAKAPPRLFTAP